MSERVDYVKKFLEVHGATITGLNVKCFDYSSDKGWIYGFQECWQGVAWEYLYESHAEANELIHKYFDIINPAE